MVLISYAKVRQKRTHPLHFRHSVKSPSNLPSIVYFLRQFSVKIILLTMSQNVSQSS